MKTLAIDFDVAERKKIEVYSYVISSGKEKVKNYLEKTEIYLQV